MKVNLLFCFLIILMGGSDHVIDTRSIHGDKGTLLRKLQQFENNSNDNKKSWNEILANLLVNNIEIFAFKNEAATVSEDFNRGENIVGKCFSQVLSVYKSFIYDRFIAKDNSKTESQEVLQTVETVDNSRDINIDNIRRTIVDPKEDVELLQPDHVKLKEVATDIRNDNLCDSVEEESGNCINNNKPSKFILAIPRQCPTGYRADALGFCRPRF